MVTERHDDNDPAVKKGRRIRFGILCFRGASITRGVGHSAERHVRAVDSIEGKRGVVSKAPGFCSFRTIARRRRGPVFARTNRTGRCETLVQTVRIPAVSLHLAIHAKTRNGKRFGRINWIESKASAQPSATVAIVPHAMWPIIA